MHVVTNFSSFQAAFAASLLHIPDGETLPVGPAPSTLYGVPIPTELEPLVVQEMKGEIIITFMERAFAVSI
jgi:hypothetical protein